MWEYWASCSKSWGGGNHTRKRSCDDPAVANGGIVCQSDETYPETLDENGIQQQEDIQSCNEYECPGTQIAISQSYTEQRDK